MPPLTGGVEQDAFFYYPSPRQPKAPQAPIPVPEFLNAPSRPIQVSPFFTHAPKTRGLEQPDAEMAQSGGPNPTHTPGGPAPDWMMWAILAALAAGVYALSKKKKGGKK